METVKTSTCVWSFSSAPFRLEGEKFYFLYILVAPSCNKFLSLCAAPETFPLSNREFKSNTRMDRTMCKHLVYIDTHAEGKIYQAFVRCLAIIHQ